jgi:hypothetical protein
LRIPFLPIVNEISLQAALVCSVIVTPSIMPANMLLSAMTPQTATSNAWGLIIGTGLLAVAVLGFALLPKPRKFHSLSIQISSMKKWLNSLSSRKIALVIGISLLLMAVVAGFAATVLDNVFVLGNVALTAANLSTQISIFKGARLAWGATWLLDLLVSVGVVAYFQEKKPTMAWVSGGLRLLYSLMLGGAIVQLFRVDAAAASVSIYQHLKAFNGLWNGGLIMFGLHLIALGILFNPESGKKWVKWGIKIMLILAGIGYVIAQTGALFVANPAAFVAMLNTLFMIPMIVGEIAFALWMLAKGGKQPKNAVQP